jgi:hypothetical protein
MNQDQLGMPINNKKGDLKSINNRRYLLSFLLISTFTFISIVFPFSLGWNLSNAQTPSPTPSRTPPPSSANVPTSTPPPQPTPSGPPAPVPSVTGNASAGAEAEGQGADAVRGTTGGGANPLSGLGSAAAGAAECLGLSQAIRLSIESIIQASPANIIKVNTTDVNEHTVTGETGKLGTDAIGYCLVNAILDYLMQSMTTWVNNGFNGNPFYPENLLDYVGQAGQQALADQLTGLDYMMAQQGVPEDIRGSLKSTVGGFFSGNTKPQDAPRDFMEKLVKGKTFTQYQTDLTKMVSRGAARQVGSVVGQTLFEPRIAQTKEGSKTTVSDGKGNSIQIQNSSKVTKPVDMDKAEQQAVQNSAISQMIDTDKLERSLDQLLKALLRQLFKQFGNIAGQA